MNDILKIAATDNVAVALRDLRAGEVVALENGGAIEVLEDIAFGHKVALADIPEGGDVVKYAHRIGVARRAIRRGALANETSVKTALADFSEYVYALVAPARLPSPKTRTFGGYMRPSGEAGVRNELWVVPLVSCVNCVAAEIIKRFSAGENAKYTDGAFALSHAYGCSQLGCDHQNTAAILADLCMHPNAGGVLVLSLGCENNKMSAFKELLSGRDLSRVRFLESQSSGDEVDDGLKLLNELALEMKNDARREIPLSKLRFGLKCGGSDAFSGITANVLIGKFADAAVASGASCALCEVPEMFGAETLLMNRAESEVVFKKIADMINSFKKYFTANGMPVYENPSPGNKAGGISTLEEKSLGCVQKGGTSTVRDVLRYGGRISKSGLTLLESPGNDPVAATALAAAGCQIVLFSTGRGTPFATTVPTVKISSNTPLFEKKPNWIDFDAGEILSGKDLGRLSDEFLDFVLQIASGKLTKAEINGYREISIFKTGVTL